MDNLKFMIPKLHMVFAKSSLIKDSSLYYRNYARKKIIEEMWLEKNTQLPKLYEQYPNIKALHPLDYESRKDGWEFPANLVDGELVEHYEWISTTSLCGSSSIKF